MDGRPATLGCEYEELDDETLASLKAKLLRHCELEALAMVVEAWKDAANS